MPNVEEIGEDAFAACDNNGFTTLEMPAIKRIGKNAFFSCSSLQKIVLGGVLEKIEKNPFNNDPNITEFKITNAQAAYVVTDGTVLSKDKAEAVISFSHNLRRSRYPMKQRQLLTVLLRM